MLPAIAPVVPEQAPLQQQPPRQEPPQQKIPPRRSLQPQLSQAAMELTPPALPPPPPPPQQPEQPEQPWQTPTKRGKARKKEPQQAPPPPQPAAGSSRDPDDKQQEPPATPRKHKTPKKPGNASWELARKQNRANCPRGGSASAMLEDYDYDVL